MLNQYIWQLYMKSDGVEVVRCFEEFYEKGLSEKYIALIKEFQSSYQPSEKILSDVTDQLNELNEKIDQIGDIHLFQDLYLILCEDCEENAKQNFAEFSVAIAYYSTILSYFSPTRFIPYYFQYNFNVLQKIAEQFEIDLPDIPKKSDYGGGFTITRNYALRFMRSGKPIIFQFLSFALFYMTLHRSILAEYPVIWLRNCLLRTVLFS